MNNRLANLRVATRTQNLGNLIAKNASGFKGVYAVAGKKKRWKALIGFPRRHLGTFSTPEEAALAYDKAAVKFFGDFARTNYAIAEDAAPTATP
jgi:hypothetical protein